MPVMPRYSKKAMAIAYKILGMPQNLKKRSAAEKKLDKQISSLEIIRVK